MGSIELFRTKFTNWHGIEVCNLIIDIIYPFTQPKQPQKIREASIESVTTICQAWPQLYLRTDVSKAFEFVFLKDEEGLEGIVLNGFQQFFAKAEKQCVVERLAVDAERQGPAESHIPVQRPPRRVVGVQAGIERDLAAAGVWPQQCLVTVCALRK